MTHARTAIRDSVVAKVSGLSTTGGRVYPSRTFPLSDENIPGLIVYTDFEGIDETEGKISKLQFRNLQIVVEGYAKLIAGLDDQLDTIAEEVEEALFDGSIAVFDLISTEHNIAEGAEQPVGKITMTFSVQYRTEEGIPGIAI